MAQPVALLPLTAHSPLLITKSPLLITKVPTTESRTDQCVKVVDQGFDCVIDTLTSHGQIRTGRVGTRNAPRASSCSICPTTTPPKPSRTRSWRRWPIYRHVCAHCCIDALNPNRLILIFQHSLHLRKPGDSEMYCIGRQRNRYTSVTVQGLGIPPAASTALAFRSRAGRIADEID